MKRSTLWGITGAVLALAILAFLRLKAPSSSETITLSAGPPTTRQITANLPTQTIVTAFQATSSIPSQNITRIETTYHPSAFITFSNWAEQFLAGDAHASVARGQELAWKRREAMLELIENDPAEAIRSSVSFQLRKKLPADVTKFFEEQVDGRGALNVSMATDFDQGKATVYRDAIIDGKTYKAFVYGRRLRQVSQTGIPIHGVALEGKMAVNANAVRILDPDEAEVLEKERGKPVEKICGVSGEASDYRSQQVVADIGGEIAYFCGVDHAKLVNKQLSAAKSGEGGALGDFPATINDAWTHGNKTVLYMRVNFPDDLTQPISEADAYNVMDGVNAFYAENSYDLTSLTTTVTPLLTLPQIKSWYTAMGPGTLLADARETARRAGFDTANYDKDIACFTEVPGFDFGGLAAVYGKGVWLQSPGVKVTSHELGHNYGLFHANYWETGTNYSVYGAGTNVEYGNTFDTMGFGSDQFNAVFKNILDWLPDTAVHNVADNGVYRIYPFDVPQRLNGRFYAARVRKDYDRDYWLEFRQKFGANPSFQNGVMLNWSPWENSNGGTSLLDPSPESGRDDASVTIGRTFSDNAAGVHITPIARGGTGGDSWIDVQVNQGFFPANRLPEVNIEIDPPNPSPGTLVRFHAKAIDPDGDGLAYYWLFDDLTSSVNNQAWSYKVWGSQGKHVVRCVVSDMKGGVASANAVVAVGEPDGFDISGRITDLEGEPIEGVRVENGAVAMYTDSDGRYVLPDQAGYITLTASKYGLALSNVPWMNPVYVESSMTNINFLAFPPTTVSFEISTNVVQENVASANTLTLRRLGDTNFDLTVDVYVSGTADVGDDITFNPALTTGLNEVVIPAGISNVTFSFSPINDGTAEATESVNITILDDMNYVVAPLGEAYVTILDDDLSGLSAVSVTAAKNFVPENGFDNGVFVFSRGGRTNSALTVFYSVSGTATAGTDYSTLPGVLIIPAGRKSATVQFLPFDDKDVESDETVTVAVTPNAAYTIGDSPATATIINDDILVVTITPTGGGLAEPSSSGRFTVKRDGDLSGNLTVFYSTSGTAGNGTDYVSPSGIVTIPAGATSADIVVTALDDGLTEGDESVILTLNTNAAYSVGIPGSATLFIRDNEKPTVSVVAGDGEASEPGDDFGSFTISRSGSPNGSLTVRMAVNGTAISGADYLPLDNPVIIPDGANSVTFPLIVFDDLHVETNETVILTLLPSADYNLGVSSQASVTITDDEYFYPSAVGFSLSASTNLESALPQIAVSLSAPSYYQITVNYLVIGGTAAGSDYSLSPGPMTFEPGELSKPIPLFIINDNIVEPNETIRIVLFDPINATLDGIKVHTYTILDDDTASLSISATASSASESGPVPGNFRITRTGSTNASLTVNFQITGSASAPADYAPIGSMITMPAGVTFVDLPVNPVNDDTVELPETVVMTLISAAGAKLVSPATATVTISDNDPNVLPVVTITSTNQPYAVEGGAGGAFIFTRTGPTNNSLSLKLTYGGQATSGSDYLALPAIVTIPAGQFSATLPVMAVDDSLIEGEETLIAALTVGDTYRAGFPASATVIIQDNDQNVRLDTSDFISSEPGADTGTFTFTRFGTTNTSLQVFFSITGSAINGVDYETISNSFIIPAGSLTGGLTIVPLDDNLVEGSETVTLTLQSNPAYTLGDSITSRVIIGDDEPSITIKTGKTNIIEGSQEPGVVILERGGNTDYDFTVHLAVGGTAASGVDYPPVLTNVYFSCGVAAIELWIYPTNELTIEQTETVVVSLLPDPTYSIFDSSSATLFIEDAGENLAPVVTIVSPKADTVFLLGTNVGIILQAEVSDDGDPAFPPVLTWTNLTGQNTMGFGDPAANNTTASFTNGGVYVLRLIADDGQLKTYADVTVVVDTTSILSATLLRWSFDDATGTNVSDSSGQGHNGFITGPSNWVTNGVQDGALRLTGTNNFVSETNPSGFMNGLKQMAISFWLKSASNNSDQGIFTANESVAPTMTFATRTAASCGDNTNVVEATFATSRGSIRHISASNATTNEWQHVVLTWSNSLAPSLFINGRLDQPQAHMVALKGIVTNCPQFIAGKGPLDSPNPWKGLVDDVRVFPRMLSAAEVQALGATNSGPVVTVPSNLVVQVLVPVPIWATVTDDGRPDPPAMVNHVWSQIDGPVGMTLDDPQALTNMLSFTQSGEYVFRIIADDGQIQVFRDLTVTVVEPTLVYVYASDGDASELGPDPGEFTFFRYGDLNFDLTINVTLSGTASNGVDMPLIPVTDTVMMPSGVDSVPVSFTPYLDHRTEGDETVTFNIVTNLAYTIGSGQASVVIHDSPYGVWNISRFTLEELTLPNLSGEDADFEHDGFLNFIEYAFNLEPKSPETNSPVVATIDVNPEDGQKYINLTYHRRYQPTDVAYAVSVSTDLLTWNTGTDSVDEIEVTDDGNGLTETVKARVKAPFPSLSRQFVAIRVWLLSTGPP